jgi:hypothetical protein
MGDQKEKDDIASKLIGIPVDTLRKVISKSTSAIPCLYRFSLGYVKDLRKSMEISTEIPDENIVIKYGYTDDLSRRSYEHSRTYGKIKGVKLELMNYTYIDPTYLAEAEKTIKEYFGNIECPLAYKSYVELVSIDPKNEKNISKQFSLISSKFSGCVKDIMNQLENIKNKHLIEIKEYIIKLTEEKRLREQAEMMLKYETESLKQKLEIESLKNQLLMKNKK